MTLSTFHKELLLSAFAEGAANLDDISLDELNNLHIIFRDRPEEVARFVFPDKEDRTETVMSLYLYASNKSYARKARLAGFIQDALRDEDECERIYNSLPDYARW